MDQNPSLANLFGKVKKYLLPVVGVLVLLVVVIVVLASLNSARNLGFSSSSDIQMVPGVPTSFKASNATRSFDEVAMESADSMPIMHPDSGGYVPGLESYETVDYQITARTRAFDEACGLLTQFKSEADVHFKTLTESTNRCNARFFAEPGAVEPIVSAFETISGAEFTLNTESVTRRRENIKNEVEILNEQLESVVTTLAEAERQYDNIMRVAEASNDASELTEAITQKMRTIESLNQKRITLTSRIRQYTQQAADLDERVGVVGFSVSITRSFALDSNDMERRWEAAWKELREEFSLALIGITAYLGIFLIKIIQYSIYGLILIVLARFGWKLVRKIWNT